MKDYILKRPMLLCSIICVLFSVTGYYSKAVITAFGIFYAIFVGIAIYRNINRRLITAFIFAFIMLLSTIHTCFKADKTNQLSGMKITTDAVICEIEKNEESYKSAVMEITNDNRLPASTKLYCFYSSEKLSIGDSITADFYFKNFTTDTAKRTNYSENIFISANAYNIEKNDSNGDFVLKAVGKVRNYIKDSLFKNMGYTEASTMCALVFGDRNYFSDEFYSNVKGAGVSHVMVVSGMHLAILVSACLKLFEKRYYNKYIKAFTMLAIVIILSAVCGFTMSILRAGITYLFVALSILLDKDNTPANTLGAAVVTVLISSPFAALNVAFQLSVLSTFGILAVAIPITDYLNDRRLIKRKLVSEIAGAVLITLSALVLTLPITIYTFGYVSVVSVITNLLISCAVTLALSISVAALIINLCFPIIALPLFILCEYLIKYVNFVINYFGSLPFAVVNLPPWTAILAIILIILIFYRLLACKKRFDMLKLNSMLAKIIDEKGRRVKWR